MSLEDDKKIVLKAKPIFPKAMPLIVEQQNGTEAFKEGFTEGWEEYKNLIKEDVKNIKKYGDILEIANIEPTYKPDNNVLRSIGYTTGWNSYKRFLKKTFFG